MGYYNSQLSAYRTQYVAQGFETDQANALADSLARKDAQVAWHQVQYRMALERLVAREEGVPLDVLQNAPDEATMRQEAARYKRSGGPQNEELQTLKRQLTELQAQVQRGQTPPQQFNQPGGPGRPRVTDSTIDGLYMAWERAHPNQPGNPYEDRYRATLNN
jgi:hypothetical protein